MRVIQKDLRSRITDEQPDTARQAAERQGWKTAAGEYGGLVIAR